MLLPTAVLPIASMVVMECPTAALTGITQDRLGTPSRCTVQAPHNATPQPNLVPFIPSRSRNTHSNGMSGSESTECDVPLILSAIIALPPVAHSWRCSPSREIGGPGMSLGMSTARTKADGTDAKRLTTLTACAQPESETTSNAQPASRHVIASHPSRGARPLAGPR